MHRQAARRKTIQARVAAITAAYHKGYLTTDEYQASLKVATYPYEGKK